MLGRIALVPLSAGFGVLLLYLLTLQAPEVINIKLFKGSVRWNSCFALTPWTLVV